MNVPFAGLQSLVLFTQYKTVTCFFIWTLSIITNEHMGYDTAASGEWGRSISRQSQCNPQVSSYADASGSHLLLLSTQGCPQLEMVLLELPLCPSVHKQI